ncbi:hypothetical protein Micbo1qcDRAFT_167004, partial [Microdochium bolleyi]
MSSDALRQGEVPPNLAFTYFNTCLAIALGILSCNDADGLSGFVSTLHDAATSQLSVILKVDGSLAMVHCMLTLALFSMITNSGGSTWHIVGLIMNQCISLGLHKEPEADEDMSCQEQQRRRNLFW